MYVGLIVFPVEHVTGIWQIEDPGLLYLPVEHGVQEVAGSDPYVFTGHKLQAVSKEVAPVVDFETLPGGHDAQFAQPEPEYVPAPQVEHII